MGKRSQGQTEHKSQFNKDNRGCVVKEQSKVASGWKLLRELTYISRVRGFLLKTHQGLRHQGWGWGIWSDIGSEGFFAKTGLGKPRLKASGEEAPGQGGVLVDMAIALDKHTDVKVDIDIHINIHTHIIGHHVGSWGLSGGGENGPVWKEHSMRNFSTLGTKTVWIDQKHHDQSTKPTTKMFKSQITRQLKVWG